MENIIIQVKQGRLCGKRNVSVLSRKSYLSFQGIPFAKPPVGDLRFQAPKSLKKWEGIYDATHERASCFQRAPGTNFTMGSEDCLYLNVHTPEISFPINALKAVMVYIHGGANCMGSGSEKMYSGDFLVDHDIVLVTMNYRLQVLGFLNLGLPECPGNVALKDQRMALKWVKKNIAAFGGDPNNITLFGESAGATSAHYQIISPASRGLFHKAILQSGTCLASWGMINNATEIAFDIGRKLGYKGYDRLQLLNFLKKQSATDLINAGYQLRIDIDNALEQTSMIFAPSVETIREGATLPDHPRVLLQTAPTIPIICGLTDLEGLLGIGMTSQKNLKKMLDDVSIVLKKFFHIDPNNLHHITAQVKQRYFTGSHNKKQILHSLINLLGDIFYMNFEESIEPLSTSYFPPYVYEFHYGGSVNIMKKMFCARTMCTFQGACHGDDVDYLFFHKMLHNRNAFNESDLKVVENMTTMWTNFAKFGNPSMAHYQWRPYTNTQPCYLRIGVDLQMVDGTVYGARRQFLKNLLRPYEMKVFA